MSMQVQIQSSGLEAKALGHDKKRHIEFLLRQATDNVSSHSSDTEVLYHELSYVMNDARRKGYDVIKYTERYRHIIAAREELTKAWILSH